MAGIEGQGLIAADSSTWVAYFGDDAGEDIDLLDQGLWDHLIVIPPVVLAETLSDSKLSTVAVSLLLQLPLIVINDGYWERAGLLRSRVLRAGRKAGLGDALIAQSCIDRDVPLLTRDKDFKAFAQVGGLRLVIG